jgi:FkbM family methyltransferase
MNSITDLVSTAEFQYITLAKDRFIGPALKYFGEYCTEETDLLCHFLADDGIVLDIGANIGTHTLEFAKKVPRGEVWAFEPQKFVQQILSGNVALNGFTNVRAFHCAVGKETGEIGVPLINYETPDNYGGLDLRKYGGQTAENYDMAPMITLDSLELPEVDLMKVDVDGMEEEVLRGGFKTIFRCKPIIYIEADRQEQRNGLIGFLSTLGYRIWQHQPPLVAAARELRMALDPSLDEVTKKNLTEFKNFRAINLLCMPKESALLEENLIKKFSLAPVLM